MARAFCDLNAPTAVTRVLQKSAMSVTELRCDRANFGLTRSIPRQDAYLVALQLRPCPGHDLYFDGRVVRPRNFGANVTTVYDLRTDPVADLRDPFHSLMFHLPRQALDAVARDSGISGGIDLRHRPGVGVHDAVVQHLLSALLPAMSNPAGVDSLFLDHVALALTAHLAREYGGVTVPPPPGRGGLARWQAQRAKELMTASLTSDVGLNSLADACGLSVRQFARAFRQTEGAPPHRWLLRYKVDRAKDLLRQSKLSLAEAALACGFADQSHFTRVFTAIAGVTPGAYRRLLGEPPRD